MTEQMHDLITWLMLGLAGGALGLFFFGGLWWTLRRGLTSKRPALWIASSLLIRMSVVLLGFYWLTDQQWQRLMICLLGFVIARMVWIRFSKRFDKDSVAIRAEVEHAP